MVRTTRFRMFADLKMLAKRLKITSKFFMRGNAEKK